MRQLIATILFSLILTASASAQSNDNPPSTALQLVPVTPCRVVDTRQPNGPFGGPAIQGGTFRTFAVPQGPCNIPASAGAYVLNVSVVPHGRLSYLTVYPAGENRGATTTMNSPDGRVKTNAATVPAGGNQAISVYASDTTDVIVDIYGYFPAASASTLAYYPLTACRLIDTRNSNGPLGGPFLQGGQERDFPVLQSSCIPQGVGAAAYSLNVTVVPRNGIRLGFLTMWATGQSQPLVAILTNPTGTIVSNAAILQAGTGGALSAYASNDTDLVVDINGFFAAPGPGGLSLYPLAPCRVLDTRRRAIGFSGELTVPVLIPAGMPCVADRSAQAFVFNATVYPQGSLGFLTLWPDGEQQPTVSTLSARDGAVTSNMAIVPSPDGSIDAYASSSTHLTLDISSYFAP
jgi:hypothetical protein